MNTTLKQLAASVVAAALLTEPLLSEATSLDDALNGMFSNLTHAGAVKTPDRTAFVGGGLVLRAPVSNINLVTFDPPHISAGCGGIDMFGGSFSFVNAQQLVALFRKVAANAIGLAFQAAIAAINPQLAHLMAEFQKLIQDANHVLSNTCHLAQMITGLNGTAPDSIATAAAPINAALTSAAGVVDSWDAQMTNFFTNGASASQASTAALDMTFGNGVWNMINTRNLGAMLTDPTSTSSSTASQNASEILMSITGFTVNQIKAGPPVAGSGALQVNSGNGEYQHTLDISDLLNGGNTAMPLQKYNCDTAYDGTNGTCLNPTKSTFTFVGMTGYVNGILNGVDVDGNPNGTVPLVQALGTPGAVLTPQQKILLQSTQVPVQAFLTNLGNNQAVQQQTMNYLTDAIANGMLISYMNAVRKITRELQNNPTSPLKGHIDDRIKELSTQTEVLMLHQSEQLDKINKVSLFVETARKGNIAAFYTANKAGIQ